MGCISSVTATLFLACACGADKMQLFNGSSIGSFDQQSMILLLVAVVVSFLLGGATSMLTRKKATLRHCVMGKFTVSATEEQKQAMSTHLDELNALHSTPATRVAVDQLSKLAGPLAGGTTAASTEELV